eukprot:gene32856-43933_t
MNKEDRDMALHDSEELLFMKHLSSLTVMVHQYLNDNGGVLRKINQTDARLLDDDIQYIVRICDSAMIRDYYDLWIGAAELHKDCDGNEISTNYYDLYNVLLECVAVVLYSLAVEEEQSMVVSVQSSTFNLLKIWTFISSLEEFDNSYAARRIPLKSFPIHYAPNPPIFSFFQMIIVELIYSCWLRHNEASSSTRHAQTLVYLKRLVHWSYFNSASARREWRCCLGNALVLSPLDLPIPADDISNFRPAHILAKLYPPNPQKHMKARPISAAIPGPGPGSSGFYSHIQHLLELLLP